MDTFADPAVVIALITSITGVVLAIITGVVTPVILSRLNTIHTLTNSNLAKANTRLDEANASLESMKAVIMEMRHPTSSAGPQPVTIVQPGPVDVKVVEPE